MFWLKYFCPKCRSILWRWEVKSKSKFCGYYTEVWKMCLNCGNSEGVVKMGEAIEDIVSVGLGRVGVGSDISCIEGTKDIKEN